VVRPHRPSV
jgi:hypothetical protein